MQVRPSAVLFSVSLSVLAACGSSAGDGSVSASAAALASSKNGKVLEADENQSQAVTESTAKAAAEPTVAIPEGSFEIGSTPGDRGRDPSLEPSLAPTSLGAFDIDRFLYPNELGKKPLVGVSRDKAESLCKERGRRLCTELEWERACKGPDGQAYAGNTAWDPKCAKEPETCASGFGVLGMGSAREWTASGVEGAKDGAAAVRGGAPDAAASDHRCARRSAVDEGATSSDLGFRCCGGAANAASIPRPAEKASFGPAELSPDALAEIFGVVPELAKLGRDVKYFDPESAPKKVVERADGGSTKGYELTTAPVAWSPALGEDLIVVAGIAGEDSFIVALYRLPGDRYRVASSLVLKKDSGPVVLAYDRSVEKRLEWSTCWQCLGESGRITYRDDRRVVITQE